MKIFLEGSSEQPIRILIPTRIVLNAIVAAVVSAVLKKRDIQISAAQLNRLFREVRRYKRRNPEWILVYVQDAGGTCVTVKL